MRKLLGLALVLLALLVLWILRDGPVVPATLEPRAAPTAPAASGASEATVEEGLTAPASPKDAAVRETAPAEPAAPAVVLNAAPAVPELAEIKGRMVFEGGAPAAGVALGVHGWGGNSERILRYGEPTDWKDMTVANEPDGRFSIRFDPPRAFQFVMDAKLTGYGAASWRWSEIEPHAVVDVGDVVLQRAGSIRGRIVDSKGRTLSKGWRVYAEGLQNFAAEGRDATRVYGQPDAGSGEFVLQDVPPGSVHLKGYSRIANWIEGPTVTVRAGEETKAEIAYEGPDNESRIVVITFCRPFYVFEGDPAEIVLHATGMEDRKAAKIANSSQSFSFEDLSPGRYSIEIRDPRFRPWSQDGVEPGTSVDARLKGNASVALTVVDDATGASVPRFALDVRFDNANFGPDTFRVLEAKDDPPRDGVFDGLIPHDQTLIVRAEGFGACEVPAAGLAANERRVLVARLVHGARVTGRVVAGPDQVVIANAKVVLTPAKKEANGGISIRGMDIDEKTATTDASGRFAFDEVGLGDFSLRASLNANFTADRTVSVTKEKPSVDADVVLPARAWVRGRLVAPSSASFEALRLVAVPKGNAEAEEDAFESAFYISESDLTTRVANDGSFRIGPVPAGEVHVALCLPPSSIPMGHGSSMSTNATRIDLGTLTLAPEAETQHDFDVGASIPGSISVHVTVDGITGSTPIVEVLDTSTNQTVSAVVLDADGSGITGPVLPGSYRFVVRPIDPSWFFESSGSSVVKCAESTRVNLDVQLVQGTLRAVDKADGKPLATTRLSLSTDDDRGSRTAVVVTDADGKATCKLPIGRYRVMGDDRRGFFSAESRAVVEWTASGPSPAEVRLPGGAH